MSDFHFNEHGVCTNPVVLRELHIKRVCDIEIKGAEHNGLWDACYNVQTPQSGSSGPVRLSCCDRTESQALTDAVDIVLDILSYRMGNGYSIPDYVFKTVRSWKQCQQLALF